MDRVYLDCETCGLHGMAVTIQYAVNDGEISIHEVWKEPIKATLDLIEWFCTMEVIGFNLAFDWFHLQKLYNTLSHYVAEDNRVVITGESDRFNHFPEDHIDELGEYEILARDGKCIKPVSALDLMLHFRKTEMQIVMQRDDLRIRRVPTILAEPLAKLLTKRIRLEPILFARQKKWAPRFRVETIKDDEGNPHPYLSNVILRFYPGGGLKPLAQHLLGLTTTSFVEVEVDKKFRPKEYGYAPFARCIGKAGNWKWSWPDVIKYHIEHWSYNQAARTYAEDDVRYTRELHKYTGMIPGGDTDSILACSVASCRWKGFAVDTQKLETLIADYKAKLKAPIAPNAVKEWVNEVLNPIEQIVAWRDGTNKKALKALISDYKEINPEAVRRCELVLATRAAKKKIEVLNKLLFAGRFHVSVKVIGALSGRMSGADGLNPQGIDRTSEVRGCFPLAFPDEDLDGGDMQSFEISIAEAVYNDPKLREKLTTCDKCNITMIVKDGRVRCPQCNGTDAKSFHALFGEGFFPELGYDGIMATKGKKIGDVYTPCKTGAFGTLYGAQPAKLAISIGVTLEQATEGYHRFWRVYSVAGEKRQKIEWDFSSLYNQENSNAIYYKTPSDKIESLLGYARWFTLENYLIQEMYSIAVNIPKEWTKLKFRVTRNAKKGEQKASSAVISALYGCCFAMQNSIVRQAQNHQIQATGAGITKEVQIEVWKLQPVGVHEWVVRPMNVHDELQIPHKKGIRNQIGDVVRAKVETYRSMIPLIGIDFGSLTSWADK